VGGQSVGREAFKVTMQGSLVVVVLYVEEEVLVVVVL
jgi:hypothetical protein